MGRRRLGPVQLNGGATYYARLTVPPALRQQAGKTRLIRSLGTTSHSIALSRYGAVYAELEKELQTLLKGDTFRRKVELSAEGEISPEHPSPLSPRELAEQVLGSDLDPSNPLHAHVYAFYDQQTPLPVSWDEALEIWKELGSRERTRPISPGTLRKTESVIKLISAYGSPADLTVDTIDRFVADRERSVDVSTVKANLKLLSAILTALVKKRKLQRNILMDYSYVVNKKSSKRAYTDEEFRLVKQLHPACFWIGMTGVRPGELENGVIEDNILIVQDTGDDGEEWRPKTLSSYRRVPLPPGFSRPTTSPKTWRTNLRKIITDKAVTPHSGRHFFIEVSRRAGCDSQIVAEICGHGSDIGSSSQRGYGRFTDEVLIREAQKIWSYINNNILETTHEKTRTRTC